jgi:outer membrane protein OmpA-like peptidoglycan-associated protein
MMNLIDLAKGWVTPELIEKAAGLVGESPANTRRALDAGVPAVVAGVVERGSSPSGAATLMSLLRESGLTGAIGPILDRLRGMNGEELIQFGQDLLGRFIGPRLGAGVDAAAASVGVKSTTMSSLMGLAAPFVFGALGHQVHAKGMSSADLASVLAEQKVPDLRSGSPAEKGVAPRTVPAAVSSARPGALEAMKTPATARWWPLLVVPLVILAAVLARRHAERTTEESRTPGLGAGITPETPSVEAPAPPPAAPPPAQRVGPAPDQVPAVFGVEEFLQAPGGEASKHFVLEDLNFEFATTHLTPKSLATLDQLATALKAHPDAHIEVQGHTDNIGLPAANQRMSLDRANAVKGALVARGVSSDHVTAKGFGQEQPLATNDTPEGRAKNRRTEIVVTR